MSVSLSEQMNRVQTANERALLMMGLKPNQAKAMDAEGLTPEAVQWVLDAIEQTPGECTWRPEYVTEHRGDE